MEESKQDRYPECGTTKEEAEFFNWWHNGRLASALDIKVCSICLHKDISVNMSMWDDGALCSVCDCLRRDRLAFKEGFSNGK